MDAIWGSQVPSAVEPCWTRGPTFQQWDRCGQIEDIDSIDVIWDDMTLTCDEFSWVRMKSCDAYHFISFQIISCHLMSSIQSSHSACGFFLSFTQLFKAGLSVPAWWSLPMPRGSPGSLLWASHRPKEYNRRLSDKSFEYPAKTSRREEHVMHRPHHGPLSFFCLFLQLIGSLAVKQQKYKNTIKTMKCLNIQQTYAHLKTPKLTEMSGRLRTSRTRALASASRPASCETYASKSSSADIHST